MDSTPSPQWESVCSIADIQSGQHALRVPRVIGKVTNISCPGGTWAVGIEDKTGRITGYVGNAVVKKFPLFLVEGSYVYLSETAIVVGWDCGAGGEGAAAPMESYLNITERNVVYVI